MFNIPPANLPISLYFYVYSFVSLFVFENTIIDESKLLKKESNHEVIKKCFIQLHDLASRIVYCTHVHNQCKMCRILFIALNIFLTLIDITRMEYRQHVW